MTLERDAASFRPHDDALADRKSAGTGYNPTTRMALFDRFESFLDQVIPPTEEVAASVRRGEALLAAGDAPGALVLADGALGASPGYLRALALKVDALSAMNTPRDALGILDDAARVRALPAPFLARMVEYAAALPDEWRAVDLEAHARARLRGPDRAVAQRFLTGARALLAHGRVTAGLRLARGATLADPTLGPPWLLLGRDALDRGDIGLARRALDKATASLDPADAGYNRLAGEFAWRIGDLRLAVRHLRRAWIVGDDAAVAPLVAALAAGDDPSAVEKVLNDARGGLAEVARAVVALSRGQPDAAEHLAAVTGAGVPEVLWSWALDVALRADLSLALRWAAEAPARAGATEVLALGAARDALHRGDAMGARRALAPALGPGTTRDAARTLLREACETGWSGRLGALLEELASIVREAAPEGWEVLESELRARRRELDEPLRVVLLGEFSAGKSTFVNALVGAEVSPMGVLPTTAHVHWLRQGDPGARVVDRRGGVIETTIAEAPRVAARKRAAGDEVDYVEVTLPLPRLGRMEVIDTPGFNAGDPAHEDAVRRASDLADVGIWLFDTRQAGKQSEIDPLDEARARGLPVVGVLNKMDQATPHERASVVALLRVGFGTRAPCVMAVSARQAFMATRTSREGVDAKGQGTNAAEELSASGWTDLMRYFDEQLIGRRLAWKQGRIAARVKVSMDAALDAVHRTRDRARERAEQFDALAEAVASAREAVLTTASVVRREVGLVLRDQLRGLRDERARDCDALIADAVAEIGYRARGRALENLRPRLLEVERLGVAVGLAPEGGAALLTAPVVQYLDLAVSEGVRDAQAPVPLGTQVGTPTDTPWGFVASDPLAALEAAAERSMRDRGAPTDVLAIALEAARSVLSRFETPAVPMPGADGYGP